MLGFLVTIFFCNNSFSRRMQSSFGNSEWFHCFPQSAGEIRDSDRRASRGDGPSGDFDNATPRRRIVNDAVRSRALPNGVQQPPVHYKIHAAVTAAFRALL